MVNFGELKVHYKRIVL